MNIYELLEKLSVTNRDNGKKFKDTQRLDVITELLWDSDYRRINPQGLFHLYSKQPLSKLKGKSVVVVSSHIDCEENITKCFSKEEDNETMRGTYDNLGTNAAIIYNMLSKNLPANILVAFTGDEEQGLRGATKLIKYLRKNEISVSCVVVLDVTEMGWKQKADFTIENNFWNNQIGRNVVELAEKSGYSWQFSPSYLDSIPQYIPENRLIETEAERDESWEYDEVDQRCFSLCLPIKGNMHSNKGVRARKKSLEAYVDILEKIVTLLA